MFRFGFSNSDEDSEVSAKSDTGVSGEVEWLPAAEIFPATTAAHVNQSTSTITCGKYQLKHVDPMTIPCDLVCEAERLHSDLLPAKYEGGLKIWECTSDLANYVLEEGVVLRGKRVLDLGCGAGILGILAMHLGASTVHFQDYNSSVLTSTTIPNMILNCAELQDMVSTRFFSGDWTSFVQLLEKENNKYDCILTSETIYNPDNHAKLLNVFNNCLHNHGHVYLAAKTYYFGVGGGTRQFETLIAEDGVFKSTVCWRCSKGVQREILQITFNRELKE
ncbi:hypothetical protein L9F63_021279 [Diploptera punctata]|uniref:protein-histidine N-methyltransferase n=1 Tax=Diploptera punctata TaxID=6984 RepID=A0AAD7ZPT7_DIPPU|nr:hypothetical protein L9F63_021279 [Diploptera punctata]